MIAPIYQMKNPSQQIQAAMVATWLAMNIKEGWLCSKGYPQPQDGVRYDDNIMKGVQYIADEGEVPYQDKGPLARSIADVLGYESASNCTAMLRDCIRFGLVDAKVIDGRGWLVRTQYGLEQLLRWEEFRD